MPVYNADRHIAEAIQSLQHQTFSDFELLIIDDGSTDESQKIIEMSNDHRIRLIKNQQNVGVVGSLMRGMALCRGDLIARMDADDVCEPERFSNQVAFLQLHPGVDIVGGAIRVFGSIPVPYIQSFPEEHEDIRVAMLFFCPLPHPALMFRRTLVDRGLLEYSDEFRHAEDYYLWSHLLRFAKSANLPDTLLNYRLHHDQVSSEHSGKQYQASLRVRKLMLSRANVDWNESDMELHESVILEKFQADWNYINRIGLWFNKIESSNLLSCFWEPNALHRLLSRRIIEVVLKLKLSSPPKSLSPATKRYLKEGNLPIEHIMDRILRHFGMVKSAG